MILYLNGRYLPADQARVSVFDHGFLYGDGLFETFRAYDGCIFRLGDHLVRLRRSASRLRINVPFTNDRLSSILINTMIRNRIGDALLRITVTRGPGPAGLEPRLCPKPTVVIIPRFFKGHPRGRYRTGLKGAITAIRRIPPESMDPGIKSGNYLNNILARMESLDQKADEGILLTTGGFLAEGTISNLFFISKGKLFTPSLDLGVLPGVSRRVVIDLANKMGLTIREGRYRPRQLLSADECFLTNTSMEVMPVVKVNGKRIGSGRPGPITRDLHRAYQKKVERECGGKKKRKN